MAGQSKGNRSGKGGREGNDARGRKGGDGSNSGGRNEREGSDAREQNERHVEDEEEEHMAMDNDHQLEEDQAQRRGRGIARPITRPHGQERLLVDHNDNEFWTTEAKRQILPCFRRWFREPYTCWKEVPDHVKESIYRDWSDLYRFPEGGEKAGKNTFMIYLKDNFRRWLDEARKKAMANAGARGRPIDRRALRFPPDYIVPSVWRGLINHWTSEKFKRMSLQNKQNRKKNTFPHMGGSKSFSQHKRDLKAKQGGKDIDQRSFWEMMYSSKVDDGNGGVRKWKSKEAEEIYERAGEIMEASQVEGEQSRHEVDLWADVVGKKKNRIKGYGSKLKASKFCASSSYQRANDGSSSSGGISISNETHQAIVNDVLSRLTTDIDAARRLLGPIVWGLFFGYNEPYNPEYPLLERLVHEATIRLGANHLRDALSPTDQQYTKTSKRARPQDWVNSEDSSDDDSSDDDCSDNDDDNGEDANY